MVKIIKIIVVVLLLINGLGALAGGYLFITDPTGGRMQMPISYLENSPFPNYLVPGIVLFTANGLFSFVTLAVLLAKRSFSHWLVAAQGAILFGWIVIQMFMIREFYPIMHIPFLSIGLFLMAAGFYMKK